MGGTRAIQLPKPLSSELTGLSQAILQSLDALTAGCILVNAEGVILYCNQAAEKILTNDRDLYSQDNRIHCREPETHANLLQILQICGMEVDKEEISRHQLIVSRQDSDFPYYLLFVPLTTHPVKLDGSKKVQPVILVLIHDPDTQTDLCTTLYASLYPLTDAELKVIRGIADGHTPQQIADNLEVSINTVRTHLRSIYKKAGVNSQTELISKLVNVPNWLIDTLPSGHSQK